jgi:hypothetical protein
MTVTTHGNESFRKDHLDRVKREIAVGRAHRAADGTDAIVEKGTVPSNACNGVGWEKAMIPHSVGDAKVEE